MGRKKPRRCLSSLKRQFQYRKPICPFICSTFQDFQVERDILVKKAFPTIDALCRERGTYCAPVDLRWGINDYQVSSGQIINLCLDYVTKCAPFFICILGERFGSHRPHESPPLPESYKNMPEDAHWMDKNLVIAGESGYDWVTSQRYRGSSVTALEVAQRTMLAREMGDEFSFYYFRQQEHQDALFTDLPEEERAEKLQIYQPESEHCNGEIRDLKARIVKRGIAVRYFKSPEQLRLMVLEDWKAVVDYLYPPFYDEIPTMYQESVTEWIAHEAFAESRRRVFVRTPELDNLFGELTQFALTSLDEPPPSIEENSCTPIHSFSSILRRRNISEEKPQILSNLLLVGDRGSGKSAVIANWYHEFLDQHPEVKVITHFVGSSAHSTDVHALMRRFTHEIRNEYPDFQGTSPEISENADEVSDLHQLCEAFTAAVALCPVVLVIDGIDELGESYGCSSQQVKEMQWFPHNLPPQCKIIITSARSDTAHRILAARKDTSILHVPTLKDTASKSQVVQEYLAMHCKCLNNEQLQRIVSSKLSDRPIFLTVLANELRVYGVYSQLDYHLESYLEAASIRDLWSKIILRWIKDYSWPKVEVTNATNNTNSKTDNTQNDQTGYSGWVADVLRLLAMSRSGLSQSEILEMLKQLGYKGTSEVTVLDWALFRSAALDSLLERPGGLINFFHQHFKEAVEHSLLGSATPDGAHLKKALEPPPMESTAVAETNTQKQPSCAKYHKHIAEYFLLQEHGCRRSEELPWQLERAGESRILTTVLSEPRLFLEMAGDRLMHRKRLELVQYWKNLIEAGHSVTNTYWGMLKRALGRDCGPSCDSTGNFTLENKMPEKSSTMGGEAVQNSLEPLVNGKTTRDLTQKNIDQVPQITTTCPSESGNSVSEDSREAERDNPSQTVEDQADSRRSSVDSNTSVASTSSFMSSVDPCEAFPDGRARGPKELARLTMSTGQFLSVMSYFSDAERMLLKAHEKLSEVSFSGDCQRLLCELQESIGNMYLFQLCKDNATYWYNIALKSVDELLAVLKNNTDEKILLEMKGRLLDQLGNMKTYNRDFRGAELMLTQARVCFEKSNSMVGKATVQYHIGFLRMQQGDFVSAEVLFHQALSVIERWFGKNHPRVADVLNDLAALFCHPNNKDRSDLIQGENIHRRALHIRETCFGQNHLLVATSLFHLGKLLKMKKTSPALSEALVMLRRALDVRTTKLGVKHCLTKAVRRALNDLEVNLQNKNKPAPDTRSIDIPRSSLSWHDKELQKFHEQAQQKLESMDMNQEEKSHHEPPQEDLKIHQQVSNQNPKQGIVKHVNIVIEKQTTAEDQLEVHDPGSNPGEEQTSTSSSRSSTPDTKKSDDTPHVNKVLNNYKTQRPASALDGRISKSYLDSFVFELPESEVPVKYEPTNRLRVNNVVQQRRPASAPAPLCTSETGFHLRVRGESLPERTPSEALRFYALNPAQRRLHSAPVRMRNAKYSPKPFLKRTTREAPSPHTVDVHNTYTAVYGPNTNIHSLLGPPEAPRYSAISSGIHHTSAWYHVPGRYATSDRPYPPKRLQKRISLARRSLSESVDGIHASSSHGVQKRNISQAKSDSVHFRSEAESINYRPESANLVSVYGSSLLVSH